MVRKELPERKLQQYLPFTVLKPGIATAHQEELCFVATVLTVYSIETPKQKKILLRLQVWLQQYLPFTVLKRNGFCLSVHLLPCVATVLTVYGI